VDILRYISQLDGPFAADDAAAVQTLGKIGSKMMSHVVYMAGRKNISRWFDISFVPEFVERFQPVAAGAPASEDHHAAMLAIQALLELISHPDKRGSNVQVARAEVSEGAGALLAAVGSLRHMARYLERMKADGKGVVELAVDADVRLVRAANTLALVKFLRKTFREAKYLLKQGWAVRAHAVKLTVLLWGFSPSIVARVLHASRSSVGRAIKRLKIMKLEGLDAIEKPLVKREHYFGRKGSNAYVDSAGARAGVLDHLEAFSTASPTTVTDFWNYLLKEWGEDSIMWLYVGFVHA
jgi:hypothetical protein